MEEECEARETTAQSAQAGGQGGTSTLTRETGSLNLQNMEHLARVLADLEGMGYQPVLVSSGAIGMGVGKLNLPCRPTDMPGKQAAAPWDSAS